MEYRDGEKEGDEGREDWDVLATGRTGVYPSEMGPVGGFELRDVICLMS